MQEERDRVKKYVMVVSRTDETGHVLPQRIIWDDGVSYGIDSILSVEHRSSLKVGGNGMRYRVRIGETVTDLFYENPRWFVAAKKPVI